MPKYSNVNTYKEFSAEVDRLAINRIPHEALGRLYGYPAAQDAFNLVWNLQLGPTYSYMEDLAMRFFSIHDGTQDVVELLRVWCLRNSIPINQEDLTSAVDYADQATFVKRVAFRRHAAKIKEKRAESQRKRRSHQIPAKPNKTAKSIIHALPGTPADIARRIGSNRKAVAMALKRMFGDGTVERQGKGVYVLVTGFEVSTSAKLVKEPPPEVLTEKEKDLLFAAIRKRFPDITNQTLELYLGMPGMGVAGLRNMAAAERQEYLSGKY